MILPCKESLRKPPLAFDMDKAGDMDFEDHDQEFRLVRFGVLMFLHVWGPESQIRELQ